MTSKLVGLFALAIAISTPANAETLTNDTILTMVQAGLGDDVVIAKIKASPNSFDLSTGSVIALKQKGISSAILAAMITGQSGAIGSKTVDEQANPAVPHSPGVYLLANWTSTPAMVRIDPTTSNQTKTGGMLGYAFTAGLASLSVKAIIPGANARTIARTAAPEFYLFVDINSSNMFSSGLGNNVTPNEFTLVHLISKNGRREARVGSMNIGGAKAGVRDKDRMSFTYAQVRPGVYKISLGSPLDPGEYAFLYSVAAGSGVGITSGGAMAARVFDFSIPGKS